jgi:hypothetical protein
MVLTMERGSEQDANILTIPYVLLQAVREENCILYVGAGFSLEQMDMRTLEGHIDLRRSATSALGEIARDAAIGRSAIEALLKALRAEDNENNMKKAETEMDDELRPEYDLASLQVRKLGSGRKSFGGSVVRLEPDVAEVFPDADSVNEALRFLIRITKENKPPLDETRSDA